jgi:hypothetical protein
VKDFQLQIKAQEGDEAFVAETCAAAARRFHLEDTKVSSQVPHTICNYGSTIGRIGFGSCRIGELIVLDFNPCGELTERFTAVVEFVISRLRSRVGERISKSNENTHIIVQHSLPLSEAAKAFETVRIKKHFRRGTPPTYLANYVVRSKGIGPADLLLDGAWCGHGEPLFGIHDVRTADGGDRFSIRLPSGRTYPELVAVTATSPAGETFFLYDPRQHPASLYIDNRNDFPHRPAAPFACPNCGNQSFTAAVGFEIPGDAEEPNDTSWFALAVECPQCKWHKVIFDDETA